MALKTVIAARPRYATATTEGNPDLVNMYIEISTAEAVTEITRTSIIGLLVIELHFPNITHVLGVMPGYPQSCRSYSGTEQGSKIKELAIKCAIARSKKLYNGDIYHF